jgi:hypothetical protein
VPTGGNVLTVQTTAFTSSESPAAIGAYAGPAVPNGLYAYSEAEGGAGVVASGVASGGIGVVAGGARCNIHMTALGTAPAERTDLHSLGELVVDGNGRLWVSVGSGTPGQWRKLAGPGVLGGLELHASPVRAYDSRPGFAPLGVTKGPLTAGVQRDIDLKVNGGVPDGAVAALVNITCSVTSSDGFLKVFKTGAAVPAASNVNWFHINSNIANTTTVALDGSERCTVRCGGTSASTHFILDVLGYYL